MRGDRVEVVVDVGDGTKTYEIEATRAGRRVDVRTGRGLVEVIEVTRGGTPVRTARFMTQRVVAMIEHPASDVAGSDEVVTLHRAAESVRAGRTPPDDVSSRS
ncbi:hypothetical protein [uncultured Amnibacterium sp.]|uniref:hypothetical protein n=1 Tax=uncultured Amnibacterium sp. TaxID=1631851 RepID=UPI0035CC47F4